MLNFYEKWYIFYNMEKAIHFFNSNGARIAAILQDSSGKKDAPVFILCHGHGSHKNSKTFVSLKEKLEKQGISTFCFDFSGHGESEGKLEDITCTKAIDDISRAVRFLQKEGYPKIGLVGSSFGAFASIVVAAQTPEIFALAMKSPALDYSNWKGRMIRTYGKNWERERRVVFTTSSVQCMLDSEHLDAFVKDASQYNLFAISKNIKIPVSIVHGGNDEVAPPELSKKISQIIPNCTLSIIGGADHEYTNNGTFDKMIGAFEKFIIHVSHQK